MKKLSFLDSKKLPTETTPAPAPLIYENVPEELKQKAAQEVTELLHRMFNGK